MSKEELTLIELFEKHEKDSIPGTAHFEALIDFAEICFNTPKAEGKEVTIADIHSYIRAAYRVGFERGYKAGREYQQDLQKLDAKD